MSVEVALGHRYRDFVLDVRFHIERPGITALFGPSGAGKTTIINAIAGVVTPNAGRVVVNDRVLLDVQAGVDVPPRYRRVGYVFQDSRLFPNMTVRNNLRFGWRRAKQQVSESEVERVIVMLGLERLLSRKPATLSGGEKSRVALGRALLASPEILLLDEPLAALDAARKGEILPYLERLRDEARLPMLYVSHSLDEVSRLADDIIVLRAGKVARQGTVFDVLSDLGLPDFTGSPPYGAVLDVEVQEHRARDGLSLLSFDGGQILVPLMQSPIGTRLRVRVRAEDVMIAREAPQAISANNVLPAVIDGLQETAPLHSDVRLKCGPTALVARITRASSERLALKRGDSVYAIVKSVTVGPPNIASEH